MMYPSPKTVLTALAARGTSVTRSEALRLLAAELPEDWPDCPRRSRQALLRRLACDRKRSAKARLAALRELLSVSNQDEPQAAAPNDPVQVEYGTQQALSVAALAMLNALGKSHLRDVDQEEWAQYAKHQGITWMDDLYAEYMAWKCPDEDVLAIIGMKPLDHWKMVQAHAKTDDVRQHAQRQIDQLAETNHEA
jgi:hypothetical protein